jgi:hypothetical protein
VVWCDGREDVSSDHHSEYCGNVNQKLPLPFDNDQSNTISCTCLTPFSFHSGACCTLHVPPSHSPTSSNLCCHSNISDQDIICSLQTLNNICWWFSQPLGKFDVSVLLEVIHFPTLKHSTNSALLWDLQGCIQKFPDSVDNKIEAYNNKHLLRSNTKSYGSKTH